MRGTACLLNSVEEIDTMFYTVYKTTCKINNKVYIGVHKTEDPYDTYLGSGKLIQRAIEKYGVDSFNKEVLFIFDNEEDMFRKEKELVTEEFVESDQSYNCKPGGEANWYYVNKNGLNQSSNQHLVLRDRLKANAEYAAEFSKTMSKATSFHTLNGSRTLEERKAASKKATDARWAKHRSKGEMGTPRSAKPSIE